MSVLEQRRGSVESLLRREDGRAASIEPAPPADPPSPSTGADAPGGHAQPRGLVAAMALPAVIGGLAGSIMAVAAVLAMTTFRPPLDPRLPGLAEQVGGFQASLYTLETALRGAEADLVRALQADSELAGRLDAQAGALRVAVADVADARQQLQVESGPGSVVFGVSVVQLADAVASGRPFESGWVNLYALTEGHEPLREQLRRLMPVAATGVPTLTALRADLRATAAAAGTPVIDPDNLYQYGLDLVRSGLGVPVGTTSELQVVGGLVTEADRRVRDGDLAGALAALANLTDATARPFRAWIAAAERRSAADAVVAEFTRVSTEALRARARASAG